MDIPEEELMKMKRKDILALPEDQRNRCYKLFYQHTQGMITKVMEYNKRHFDAFDINKKQLICMQELSDLKISDINALILERFIEPLPSKIKEITETIRLNYINSFKEIPKISFDLPIIKKEFGIPDSVTIFSLHSNSICKRNAHTRDYFHPSKNNAKFDKALRNTFDKNVNDDPWHGKYFDDEIVLNLLNRQVYYYDKYISFSYYHFEVFRILLQTALEKKEYVPYEKFEKIWGEERSSGLLRTIIGEIKYILLKHGIPKTVVSNLFYAIRGRGYQAQIPSYAIRIIDP